MSSKQNKLLTHLREELQRAANPAKAPQMQAYMKSKLAYHGAPAPIVAQITKRVFKDVEFSSRKEWQDTVLEIWHGAKFREERYCALALSAVKQAIPYQTPDAIKMYEELIITGAWWDYVDTVAIHRVGPILKKHPEVMKKKLLLWSRGKDMWKRRTAILSQISFKKDTDLDFLYACMEPSIDSKEFFLRKAIGWALRQYAWQDPNETIRYVKAHADRLSGLSKREALKNVLKIKLRRAPAD